MKFSKYNIIVAIYILFLTACVENRSSSYKNLESQEAKNLSVQVLFEDISISIDSLTYPSYSMYQNFILKGISYLAGYNKKIHSIDIFDLKSKEFHKHIKLEHKGPHGVEELDGFFIHNWDSVFLYSTGKLLIADSLGKVINSFNLLNKNVYEHAEVGTLTSSIGFGLFYSEIKNSVFLHYIPVSTQFSSNEYFSKPFIAEFNLRSLLVSLIPVYYSSYFKNSYIGYLSTPNVTFLNDMVYYCFSGESNIYSHNLETNYTSTYGGRSKYSKSMAEPISPKSSFEKKLRHRLVSATFFNVIYDPYRDLFYRLHYGNIEYKVSEKYNSTFNDKNLHLMIFNNEFQLIKEIKLEDYTYLPEFYGISEHGLFLNANHGLNKNLSPDYSNFKLFKIKYENSN